MLRTQLKHRCHWHRDTKDTTETPICAISNKRFVEKISSCQWSKHGGCQSAVISAARLSCCYQHSQISLLLSQPDFPAVISAARLSCCYQHSQTCLYTRTTCRYTRTYRYTRTTICQYTRTTICQYTRTIIWQYTRTTIWQYTRTTIQVNESCVAMLYNVRRLLLCIVRMLVCAGACVCVCVCVCACASL